MVEASAETAATGGMMGPILAVGGVVLTAGGAGFMFWKAKNRKKKEEQEKEEKEDLSKED